MDDVHAGLRGAVRHLILGRHDQKGDRCRIWCRWVSVDVLPAEVCSGKVREKRRNKPTHRRNYLTLCLSRSARVVCDCLRDAIELSEFDDSPGPSVAPLLGY